MSLDKADIDHLERQVSVALEADGSATSCRPLCEVIVSLSQRDDGGTHDALGRSLGPGLLRYLLDSTHDPFPRRWAGLLLSEICRRSQLTASLLAGTDVAADLNLSDLGRLVQDQHEKEDLKMVSFILMKELSARGIDQSILWPGHQPKIDLPTADSQEWTAGLQSLLDQSYVSQGSGNDVFYLNAFTTEAWAFDETKARVVGLIEDRFTIIIPPPAAHYIIFVDIPWGNILEVALVSETRIDLTLGTTIGSWTFVVNAEPSSNIKAVIDFATGDDAEDTLKDIQDKCRANLTSNQHPSSQLPQSSDGPTLAVDSDEDDKGPKLTRPSDGGASAALRERRSRLTMGPSSQRPSAGKPANHSSQTGGTQQQAGGPSELRHTSLPNDADEKYGLYGLSPEDRASQKDLTVRTVDQPGQQKNSRQASMPNVDADEEEEEEEDCEEQDSKVDQIGVAPQKNTTSGVKGDNRNKPARATAPSSHADPPEERSSLNNKKFRQPPKTMTAASQARTQPEKMEQSAEDGSIYNLPGPEKSSQHNNPPEKPKKKVKPKARPSRPGKDQSQGRAPPTNRARKRNEVEGDINDEGSNFKAPHRAVPKKTESSRVTRSSAARNSAVANDKQENASERPKDTVKRPGKSGASEEDAVEISSAAESESSVENAEDDAVRTRQIEVLPRIPLKAEASAGSTEKNDNVDILRKPQIIGFDRQGPRNQGRRQVHHTPTPTTPSQKTYSSGKPKTRQSQGVFGDLINSEEHSPAKRSQGSKVTGKRPAETGISHGREKRKPTISLDEKLEKQHQHSASITSKLKEPGNFSEGSAPEKASSPRSPDDNTAPFGYLSPPLARQPSPHAHQSPNQTGEVSQNVREHEHAPEKPKSDSKDVSGFTNAPDALAMQKVDSQPSSPPLLEYRPASPMQQTQASMSLVSKLPSNNMTAMSKHRVEPDEENGKPAVPSFESQPLPAFTATAEPPRLPYGFFTQSSGQQATPRVEQQAQPNIHQKLQLSAPRISSNVESNLSQAPRLEKPVWSERTEQPNREAHFERKNHIFTINEASDPPEIPRAYRRSQLRPKNVLSRNRKNVPEPPEADSKAITTHVPQKMLNISKSLQTPARPAADPFNGATPTPEKGKNETHFMRKLRGKLEANGAEPAEPPLKPNAGNFGHGEFADEEDPDRTLVGMLDDDIGMGFTDDRSTSEESSSSEEAPEELTEELEWEASLKPHQRDMFDVLTRISRHFIRHLIDAETAIEDIVSDYNHDATHLIEQMELSHRKEHETQRKALTQARARISGALTHINDQITSSEKQARSTLIGHNWEEQPAESKKQISQLNGILDQMGRK